NQERTSNSPPITRPTALIVTPGVQTRIGFSTVVPANQEFWACGSQPTPQDATMMITEAATPRRMWWPGNVSIREGTNGLLITAPRMFCVESSSVGMPVEPAGKTGADAIRF